MDYRFVPSYVNFGKRRGPVLGFTIHMAEGGNTVNYLAKANPNGVSVHYVIEYDGEIVQMLPEGHMHTSIRIRNPNGTPAIRQADDANGFFGVTAAKAVLGDWYDIRKTLGPNHATLAVELEGFAGSGPNLKQQDALAELVDDVRSRYPQIGLLGHRDHNTKTCPGKLIPWSRLGGHGPAEEPMPGLAVTALQSVSGVVTIKNDGLSHAAIQIADREYFFLPAGTKKRTFAKGKLVPPLDSQPGDRSTVYLVGDEAAVFLAVDVDFTPDPDPFNAGVDAAVVAAKGARR